MELHPEYVSNTMIGQLVIVLVTLITSTATIIKTSRDQRHALERIKLQHDVDVAERRERAAIEKEERTAAASAIRERLVTDAAELQKELHRTSTQLQQRVDSTRTELQTRVERTADATRVHFDTTVAEIGMGAKSALDKQTDTLSQVIADARTTVSDKADAAYHEANTVNVKLEKLHQAHERQGKVLERLLEVIQQRKNEPDAPRATGPDGVVLIERRVAGKPEVVAAVAAVKAAATSPNEEHNP